MAEVTVNSRVDAVFGNKRHISANLDVADTNTFTTGLKQIDSFQATAPDAADGVGGAASGGVITFQTSGALAGVQVDVVGI